MSTVSQKDHPYYFFPPFFTMQPCDDTKQKQIQMWIKIILEYCKANSIKEILLENFILFENRQIDRSLEMSMRLVIMDQLCQEGYGRKEREGLYSIIEKSLKDWAYTIYNWFIENGYRMEIFDIDEVRCGDRVCHEAFYDMKESLFKECMSILVKDSKAQYVGDEGIRFL